MKKKTRAMDGTWAGNSEVYVLEFTWLKSGEPRSSECWRGGHFILLLYSTLPLEIK